MNERSEQEHEQLHRGHALLEQLGPGVLLVLQQGAAVPGPRSHEARPRAQARSSRGGALVPHGLQEGAAAAAAPRPPLAQDGLVVALLGRIQEHPVEGVEQLGLSHTQFILVAWGGQRVGDNESAERRLKPKDIQLHCLCFKFITVRSSCLFDFFKFTVV